MIDYNGKKGFRLLKIYERLNKGEVILKSQLAENFGVTPKTIQRDIDDLRAYLAEIHFDKNEVAIKYDKNRNGYYIVRYEREWLTNAELLAVCKILLESRAFCKDELKSIISKLLFQVMPNDRKKIENMIRSEQHYYIPLRHGKHLLSIIWKLSQLITNTEIAQFNYRRKDGILKERLVKPVAIMFSEYYFYLIAYMTDKSEAFPTVFRIDRIEDLKDIKQRFEIPYKDKFNDGEFRKRVQFMYSGELKRVTFEYSGESVEAVLDRIPTAEVINEQNGVYLIRAESYGDGIFMWLRSQGDSVKTI